jgi:hypothetical protein
MRHSPNSGIFNAAYLNGQVRFDVQAAFLKRPYDDGLTRAFTHMSITRNPCAPTKVPEEVMDALPLDPGIVNLERQREELFKTIKKTYGFLNQVNGTEIEKKYQKLNAKLNKRIRRYEQAKKKYCDDYIRPDSRRGDAEAPK